MMDDYDAEPEAEAQGEYSADDLRKIGAKWLERIRQSERRDEKWWQDATSADAAFRQDRDAVQGAAAQSRNYAQYEFNIFHSNVETIAPAIYNSTPIPDIRERFRTGRSSPESTVSQQVAQVIERAIAVQVDDGRLDSEIEGAVHDALIAGRGVLRVRFDADEQVVPGQPMMDPMTGQMVMGPEQVIMTNERLEFEVVSWRDYREGPAQRWRDVPWVAFRHCIPWEEVQRLRDPALKEALAVGGTEPGETPPDGDADSHIWEIWCKETGRVYMIVASSGEVLSMQDDPLGLPGFFPMPEPLQPLTLAGRRDPQTPFSVYRALADELERVTRRIRAITEGLKVRGLVAGEVGDLEQLALAEDNTLIPVANVEGFAATGGLDKAISWWPVDRAIMVLRELYVSRDTTKNMIYEITGISDIVRGQGKASETATAQEIKSQWGSLRIRKLQRMVERGVRDLFVICAELICSKFSPQTLQSMTGIQVTPEMAQMLTAPLDHYRIDVESDSTVRADLSRRKGEMGEFLNATGTFFATMAPIVQASPLMAGPVSQMYAAFARQFSLGKQAEDAIEEIAEQAATQAQQAAQMQAQQAQMAQQAAQQQQAREDEKVAIQRDKVSLDERKAEIEALGKLASFDQGATNG
jgi:hypothetical protein